MKIKQNNKTTNQLKQQLKKLVEQEESKLIKKHYQKFKKLEGTYWRYTNSYSQK